MQSKAIQSNARQKVQGYILLSLSLSFFSQQLVRFLMYVCPVFVSARRAAYLLQAGLVVFAVPDVCLLYLFVFCVHAHDSMFFVCSLHDMFRITAQVLVFFDVMLFMTCLDCEYSSISVFRRTVCLCQAFW